MYTDTPVKHKHVDRQPCRAQVTCPHVVSSVHIYLSAHQVTSLHMSLQHSCISHVVAASHMSHVTHLTSRCLQTDTHTHTNTHTRTRTQTHSHSHSHSHTLDCIHCRVIKWPAPTHTPTHKSLAYLRAYSGGMRCGCGVDAFMAGIAHSMHGKCVTYHPHSIHGGCSR